MHKLSGFTALFMVFFTLACNVILAEIPTAPSTPILIQATFSKISIKWTAVEGAVSYKVYKNDAEAATTTAPEYAENGLTAGTPYSYKVKAVNADGESLASPALTVSTLQALSGSDGTVIQQVVDAVAPTASDAQTLISQVQGAMTMLNFVNPDLSKISPQLLQNLITREYELMC